MEDSFDPSFLTADVDDIDVDFDFLRTQTRHPEENYWISDEQVEEMTAEDADNFPCAADWKDDAPGVISNTEVSIDKARRHLWKQAKTEIGILRTVWEEEHPSFNTLATRIFGPKSKLFQLLEEELSLTYEKYCRFFATFFAASSRSSPATRLLEDIRFDSTGMMEKGEYYHLLKQIEVTRSGDESLWMQIEELFNTLAKKHFLSERKDEELYIALDDDKHHFNYSKNSDTYGLKRCRHIKDNRFGHTAHTAGLSATGLPLCVMFEREDEAQSQVYERMCKKMFGGRTGNGNPNLQGITFGSDRGYWTPSLLFLFLLACGADVVGTVARCFWYPFTFTKGKQSATQEADQHNRIEIRMKGAKDVFYKTLKWAGAKIRATCYRTGTGTAVSLAMSTIHHGPLFDLNLSFPKDHKWYFNPAVLQEERNAKAFPVVAGSSDHHNVIEDLPIRPLTLVQGDTVWFIMRQFSLTSSTVDKCISSRCREITQEHDLRVSYETVLRAVDRMNLLPRASDYADASNSNNNTNRRARGRTALEAILDADSSDDEEEAPTSMDWSANWIRRVNEGDGDVFRARLNSTMEDSTIRGIIDKHDNGKSTGSISSLKKKLITWSELPSYLYRKYFFYNVQQLKERILELDGQAIVTGKNKDALFDLVVNTERSRVRRNTLLENNEEPNDDEIDPVLLDIFKASKMKPLGEEAKKYCRAGHLLERPFLEQFHQHSMDGLTLGYKSLAIHETPVVESTSITGTLDSSDAELIYKKEDNNVANDSDSDTDDDDDDDDDTIYTMPVEIKARVAHSTFYSERNQLEANLGFKAFEDGEPVYVEIDAEGGQLHKWIPKHKESFQLLHHVAVRDSRKGLFLVGNKKKLMFGVFAKYSDNLITAYQSILKDLFDRSLKPFYEDDLQQDLQLPQEKIEKLLQSKEMKKLGMSYHSFLTDYYIWRQLRIKKVLQLPIPPCNRILPYNHSVWNNLKGASDTATKLMWNCQIKFASSGRSQVVASAKFFQLYSILLHREYQVATAKPNLNFYASLHHFRNTRNKNYPFHKTLDTLSVWFINNADRSIYSAYYRNSNLNHDPKRNELWGSSLLQLPTTIGMTDLNPPSQELRDQRSKAVNDRAEAVRLVRVEEKNNDTQREKIKRLTAELEEEQKALTFMEAETGTALAKATSTTIIDELDQEIAKQKRQPSITKIKLWQHRKQGKNFVNGMNALFNFQHWNTNDDQETKVVAGSQDSYRNLGQQTAAILYVYYDISNWFSEDELCTLLGYAIRNHNVKQAIFRMVERNMLICKRDTTGTEKYYLSKLPLEISGRSPEDNPDIERTNPIYANSIEIRKRAGLTLINSRKHLKASPSQAATITPLTLAEGVAEAQKADAKRELHFTNHPQQHSNKRSKTTASITRTVPTGFIANTSDSLESVEEPPTKPIDLSQSSSSDSSDSEDSDSDDTPTKNNNTGFMDEEVFNPIIPAAKNKGTDFGNIKSV